VHFCFTAFAVRPTQLGHSLGKGHLYYN